jgi:hypothetical protein
MLVSAPRVALYCMKQPTSSAPPFRLLPVTLFTGVKIRETEIKEKHAVIPVSRDRVTANQVNVGMPHDLNSVSISANCGGLPKLARAARDFHCNAEPHL